MATPLAILRALANAALVLLGTTFAAHTLAAGTDEGRYRPVDGQSFETTMSGADLPGFGSWLGGLGTVGEDVLRAAANTIWLGLVGLVVGAALGVVLAWLTRPRLLAGLIGWLQSPLLALAVPGILLLPLYRTADDRGLLPAGPASDTSAGGPAFLLFWGSAVGLALAPGLAGQFTAGLSRFAGGHRSPGLEVAETAAASRPLATDTSVFGVPTAILLLGLASVELLSGHNGLFSFFADRLTAGDLAGALDVVLVVAVLGAALTLALGAITFTTSDRTGPTEGPDRPTAVSEGAWPLLATLTVLGLIAAVGYLRDPVLNGDRDQVLQQPTLGEPWLGTDGAGVSLVERLVVALGPTIVAALVPAIVAAAVGFLLNAGLGRGGSAVNRLLDTVVDVVWWPLPLLVPLAHLQAGNPARAEVDPLVVGVTAAALTPLTVRALRRRADHGQGGRSGLATVLVYLVAMAAAARIFAGFLGVTNGPHGPANADLGAVIASTAASATPGSNWSVAAPAITGLVFFALLYWLAGTISTPLPHRDLAPVAQEPETLSSAPTTTVEPADGAEAAGKTDRDDCGPTGEDDDQNLTITLGAGPPTSPSAASQDTIDLRDRPPLPVPVQRRPVVDLVKVRAAEAADEAAADRTSPADPVSGTTGADTARGSDDGDLGDGPDVGESDGGTGEGSRDEQDTGDRGTAEGGGAEHGTGDSGTDEGDRDEQDLGDTDTDDGDTADRATDEGETGDGEPPAGDGSSDDAGPPDDAAPETHIEQADDGIDDETRSELEMLNADAEDLAAEASKTIELRPSTLRRAGIVAPGADEPVTPTKPILADHAEDYTGEEPAD
ncbi:MAG: hypothetical protein AAGA65_28390 [Actinomycetota bacterium]